MATTEAAPRLSDKLAEAFHFALEAHNGKTRKGTSIPYLSHLMAVSAIVMEYGGTERDAIGALLHDTVEDCGVTYDQISQRFGEDVAQIVRGCTDSETTGEKAPWRDRKERYIAHVRGGNAVALLVSAADKLHNCRSIIRDVRQRGDQVWRRFNVQAKPRDILWYYESLVSAYRSHEEGVSDDFQRLLTELEEAVGEMRKLVPL